MIRNTEEEMIRNTEKNNNNIRTCQKKGLRERNIVIDKAKY